MDIIRTNNEQENQDAVSKWCEYFRYVYEEHAIKAIALGSTKLLEYLAEDLELLRELPKGTHMGELPTTPLKSIFPQQFIIQYDYDFYYLAKCSLLKMLDDNEVLNLITTLDQILFHIIVLIGYEIMENNTSSDTSSYDKSWVEKILPDRTIENCFKEGNYCDKKNTYYFKNWNKKTKR